MAYIVYSLYSLSTCLTADDIYTSAQQDILLQMKPLTSSRQDCLIRVDGSHSKTMVDGAYLRRMITGTLEAESPDIHSTVTVEVYCTYGTDIHTSHPQWSPPS